MTFFALDIFLWMMGAAVVSWILPKKARKYGIMATCVLFLANYSLLSLAILTSTSLLTYFVLSRLGPRTVAVLSVVGGLTAVLFWFKLDKDWMTSSLGEVTGNLVPLGISYYTFRQIHYAFEKYKKKLPAHDLSDYLSYLFFLPPLLSGPIHLFPDFKRDLGRRRWDTKLLSGGMERILYGYAKIVILGNYLVSDRFVFYISELSGSHPLLAEYLDCFRYGLNLYLQFSGYSDVAIGFSLIMGFHIIENFNYPFLATNITEFWQRWHISLSSWCRMYVFTPIASATRRPMIAVLAAMLVLGLWHELSFRFICWGLFHGLGITAHHQFQKVKTRLPSSENLVFRKAGAVLGNFITLNFVALSFILAKAKDLTAAFDFYERLLFFWM